MSGGNEKRNALASSSGTTITCTPPSTCIPHPAVYPSKNLERLPHHPQPISAIPASTAATIS